MKTRAAVLYESGRPGPYADSKPIVVEELELAGPGPGEVLVEIAAAGLCHSDLSVIDGSRPWPLPIVLGHEASGIVREVGANVTSVAPDDHVVFSFVPICGHCPECSTGRPALCRPGMKANLAGQLLGGSIRLSAAGKPVHHFLGVAGFAEHAVVAAESLVPIDSEVPLDMAALFGCAVVTGVGAVVNTARVEPGQSVAVFGLGGVGLCAVMGAKLAGALPVIAVDVVPAKLKLARELGATDTIDANKHDAVKKVRSLTRGGADHVVECAGRADVLIAAYNATRRGGTTITVGLPDVGQEFHVPALGLTAEERTVKGSFMGSGVPNRDIPRFLALYEAGQLPVDRLLTRTLELEELNEGFDALAGGRAVRQLVTFEIE